MNEVDRPLTEHERELVQWLVEHAATPSPHLLAEIPRIRVVETCSCGCPTVVFARNDELRPKKRPHGLISDFLAYSGDELVGVMLFASEAEIVMLEVYSMSGSDKPFSLPAVQSLFPWEELSARQSQVARPSEASG